MPRKKEKKKTKTTKELFKEMNPDLPEDSSDYIMGKSYKDTKTGEMKTKLIKKKSRQEPLEMNKGGSVSRGQYPAQARKVKFKGVF
jgi:hypothetical protein